MTNITQYTALIDERDQLRAALGELVYNNDGRYLTGIHADTDVTDIIKDLLKPKSATDTQEWDAQRFPPVGTVCVAKFNDKSRMGKGEVIVEVKEYHAGSVTLLAAKVHYTTEYLDNVNFYPLSKEALEARS